MIRQKKIYRATFFAFFLAGFSVFTAAAQPADTVEMADILRSSGKIYVVVAVLVVIFSGLILYLVRIDRRVSKLEKEKQTSRPL